MPFTRQGLSGFPETGADEPDFTLALVVGSSRVNQIVVSRIAERAGLRVIAETPDTAKAKLISLRPGMVILDGGADDRDCEQLIEELAAQRGSSQVKAPFVILLTNAPPADGKPPQGAEIDALVSKPITPERLQPLIQSMVDRLRD